MTTKTLRERMHDNIKDYGFLDYNWDNRHSRKEGAEKFNTYDEYLKSLDDEDFLCSYNTVHDNMQNLD